MDSKRFQYIDNSISNFKKGLDMQRERFKFAKISNDYDSMCDCIENIKSEIKKRMIQKKRIKDLKRIEKIIIWYRTKEQRHIKGTEEGKVVVFPANMHYIINHNLTVAYEILISNLDLLDLL